VSEQAETIIVALKILLDALQDITNMPYQSPEKRIAQKALDDYEQTTRNL
jgi:hypothetical protein